MNSSDHFIDLTEEFTGGKFVLLAQDNPVLAALGPKLGIVGVPDGDVVVVGTFPKDVAAQVGRIADLLARQKDQSERLIDAMFNTSSATVSSAATRQALRNAEARQDLLTEFGALTSEEVAQLAGSTAKNRSATVSRYLAAGQVFAIDHRGGRYYPAFQFDADGRPRPVIAQVLDALRPYGLDGWEVALWFTTASGWLDDRRPVDLLDEEPDEVVSAAAHAVDAAAG